MCVVIITINPAPLVMYHEMSVRYSVLHNILAVCVVINVINPALLVMYHEVSVRYSDSL